jgi:hypothetical protein
VEPRKEEEEEEHKAYGIMISVCSSVCYRVLWWFFMTLVMNKMSPETNLHFCHKYKDDGRTSF